MLTVQVLEVLLRPSPLMPYLVKMAWKDLSTESKLIVLENIIRKLGSIPEWLIPLAVGDDAPIVRYWACSSGYVPTPNDEEGNPWPPESSDEEKQLYKKVQNDPSPLIRAFANTVPLELGYTENISHIERLVLIRALKWNRLGSFMKWLDTVYATLPDQELSECVLEFAMRPQVITAWKKSSKFECEDPEDYYDPLEAMQLGWQIAKRATPRLQRTLANVLPIEFAGYKMPLDELAQLPLEILEYLCYRSIDSNRVSELFELMREHPERFQIDVSDLLKKYDDARASAD